MDNEEIVNYCIVGFGIIFDRYCIKVLLFELKFRKKGSLYRIEKH